MVMYQTEKNKEISIRGKDSQTVPYTNLPSMLYFNNDKNTFATYLTSNVKIGSGIKSEGGYTLGINEYTSPQDAAIRAYTEEINKSNLVTLSIEIPGDPFFFFGEGFQPALYKIAVEIYRPVLETTKDSNGKMLPITNFNIKRNYIKSHVSGIYHIISIKHSLSISGYTTSLSLLKSIEPKDIVK
jgi:hypothetical protein